MSKVIITLIIATICCYNVAAQNAPTSFNLEECIRYAVSYNYDIISKTLDVESSDVERQSALWQHLPSINGAINATNNFGRGIDPSTNSYTTISTFNNTYGTEVQIPIFDGGKLTANSRLSKMAREQSQLSLDAAKDLLAERVMVAYVEALYNAQLVELRRQVVASYKTQEQSLIRRHSLGGASSSDLAQMRATLSTEELALTKASLSLDYSLLELKRLMNYPPQHPLTIVAAAEKESTPRSSTKEVVHYAQHNNLQIGIASYDVDMKQLSLSQARLESLPSLYLSGGVSTQYYKEMNNDLYTAVAWTKQFHENIGYWFGATLNVPIFNGLQAKFNVRRAKIALSQAQRAMMTVRYDIEADIEQLSCELESLSKQRVQAKSNVDNNVIANSSVVRQFESGGVTTLDMQQSNNQLFESQVERLYIGLSYMIKERMFDYYNGVPYVR